MNEQQKDWDGFAKKLDDFYAWPALYTFKFIVKTEKEEELRKLFPMHTGSANASKQGKYTSVTFQMMMPNAESVVDVYKKASIIEGIIAL